MATWSNCRKAALAESKPDSLVSFVALTQTVPARL